MPDNKEYLQGMSQRGKQLFANIQQKVHPREIKQWVRVHQGDDDDGPGVIVAKMDDGRLIVRMAEQTLSTSTNTSYHITVKPEDTTPMKRPRVYKAKDGTLFWDHITNMEPDA